MKENFIRYPCVAGQFYPGEKHSLIKLLDKLIPKNLPQGKALGIVSPHAGYIYSGRVAGEIFGRIKIPEKIVLIGPNHTGRGVRFSIMTRGKWLTPLGEVKIDEEMAQLILKGSNYLEEDYLAHRYEHSLEVQLPFIQYFKEDFSIVPIILTDADLTIYQEIGKGLASSLNSWKENLLFIASSDMTHYEPQEEAEKKDKLAMEAILSLKEDLLFERINRYNISMCGYAPCIVMLSAVKALGAKSAALVKYETS
ncbi:MAG: AmmeMemoRadiSam system protein B, partial [Candidatus Omnitrophota bacterium]